MQGSSEIERTPASAPPVTLKTWSRRPPRAVSVWSAPSTNKRLCRMHFARRLRSPTRIHVSFCGSFLFFQIFLCLRKIVFHFLLHPITSLFHKVLKLNTVKITVVGILKLFTVSFFSLVLLFSLTLRAKKRHNLKDP